MVGVGGGIAAAEDGPGGIDTVDICGAGGIEAAAMVPVGTVADGKAGATAAERNGGAAGRAGASATTAGGDATTGRA